MYSIRAVDGDDDEVAEILGDLHQLTFLDSAALPQFGSGSWWLACRLRLSVTADISAE
jgi:hypothetical protein